jgi:hypothetical protein
MLRFALSAALILSGIKLLDVPHANLIVVIGIGVGFGALGIWALVQIMRRRAAAAAFGAKKGRANLLAEHRQPEA